MQNQTAADLDFKDRFVPLITNKGGKVYDHALEGLRGLAAIWVAYSHIFFYEFKLDPAYHPTFPFIYLFNAAHGGILIFFALSGYVIGLTNQLPFSKANAIRYLLRRFIRLYPIYIVAIALGILSVPTDTWKTILGNLLFLQLAISALLSGNGVLWTLHYEVLYYLAFLAVWYFRPKVKPLILTSLAVACVFAFMPGFPSKMISGYAAGWLFWLFGLWLAWRKPRYESFTKFPLFTYVLLYIATERLEIGDMLLRKLNLVDLKLSIVSISDFFYFPLCALLFVSLTKRYIPYLKLIGAIAIALPIIQTIYLVATNQLFSNEGLLVACVQMVLGLALLGWQVDAQIISKLGFIGSMSYGIYVFHVPMMNFVGHFSSFTGSPFSFVIRIFVWIGITIGISYLFEIKLQPILKRWFQERFITQL
jgi:peptidoglycan/LPS O-acetylase OafA/YrhL